jgi:hypothetical protein
MIFITRGRHVHNLAKIDLLLFSSLLTQDMYLLRRITASSRRAALTADSASSSPPDCDKGIL